MFSLVCTVYINGNFLNDLSPLTEPLLQSQWRPRHFVVLRSWRYIYIFGRQSLIDDCSYEMTIQTIFSFHVIHVICTFFRHFLSSVVCYFQHNTTFVIMLLIVLMNIEMYFSNTDLFFVFSKKKCH